MDKNVSKARQVQKPNSYRVNSDDLDSDCYVDPTESFLIVQSLRQGGYGDSDFYISFRKKNGWSKAVNMGPLINDEKRVLCPAVTPDGKYFFFTRKDSEEDGWGNIYWVDAKILYTYKPKEIKNEE